VLRVRALRVANTAAAAPSCPFVSLSQCISPPHTNAHIHTHIHTQTIPTALLPEPNGAFLGKLKKGSKEFDRVASEAARTVPGREHGGNCDIKNLSRGSRLWLPVFVEGANLSMGDIHFSQGDGEVSFCGAIEMSGYLELKCEIVRGGMDRYLTPMVGCICL
jgi:formamidase